MSGGFCLTECGLRLQGVGASAAAPRGLLSCGFQAPECGLSSCGVRASLLRGMWDLPGSGIEPVSPALAGRFFTTEPPGKPTLYPWMKLEQEGSTDLLNAVLSFSLHLLP